MEILYEGGLRCRLTHGPSGTVMSTDAPKDNMGKGESFSPTDLVASALGSCMMTVMGIYAERHELTLDGTRLEVIKEMVQVPVRRIGRLSVTFRMPAGIPLDHRKALESAALACPVKKGLHPDIENPTVFLYPD